MIPQSEFLKYLSIEIVLSLIWIKILSFQIIRDKPKRKSNVIKLREDNPHYPFDEGNSVDWYK
jgi:hypothetical protein